MTPSAADFTDDAALLKEKAALRADCLAKRKQLPAMHPDAGEALSQQVLSVMAPALAGIVAGYIALPGELDPAVALKALLDNGTTLALPVAEDESSVLSFRRWLPGDTLINGPFGTVHPDTSGPGIDPEFVLVPLVAFDRRGHRLGMGQGYYDRTLAHLRQSRNIVAYGVAYDEQAVGRVPYGPHDQPLDGIITPTQFINPAVHP